MKKYSLILLFIIGVSCASFSQMYHNAAVKSSSTIQLDTTNLWNKFTSSVIKLQVPDSLKYVMLDKELGDTLSFYINTIAENNNLMIDSNRIINYFDILILKETLNQLRCCDQGYDLLGGRVGAGKIVIDYYLRYYRIDLKKYNEGVATGYCVDLLKKRPIKDATISKLLKDIRKEEKKIMRGEPWKKN